jgi:hypothetical protein
MYFFWLSFFILGIIFHISFIEQLHVFFNIFLLMGFSIFFVTTIETGKIGFHNGKSDSKISYIANYLALTFYLIPIFIKEYKIEYKKSKSPVEIISNAIRSCSEKMNGFFAQNPSPSIKKEPFFTFSNLYLSVFLLFLVFLSAI